jgi:hypothetical protein
MVLYTLCYLSYTLSKNLKEGVLLSGYDIYPTFIIREELYSVSN